VLFLFEAFFATMLTQQYDVLSRPILALEEPESHLHPCAVRSLWVSLCAIAGQKIIATHSGDLLARVPLTAIRRFCRQNGKVRVCSVRPGLLTPEEEKRIDFHLQSCRGELLFARCWFLGEGESEYWVFGEAADILGYDLDRLGVRFVNTRYSGVEILVKVANELGIGWCFIGDGDLQGQSDGTICKKYLQGRDPAKLICVLPRPNIEVVLCESGFGHIYEKHVSPQKKGKITAKKGSPDYWVQVVSAQPNKDKPTRIREVMAEMRIRGAGSVPPILKSVIETAIKTAEIQI
jgi:putative ATP-dependent endonuclease of OLD family